jgi:hypothetical protein
LAVVYFANDVEKQEYKFGKFLIKTVSPPTKYDLLPELFHTFDKDEEITHSLISKIFTVLTLSPWVFLFGTVS